MFLWRNFPFYTPSLAIFSSTWPGPFSAPRRSTFAIVAAWKIDMIGLGASGISQIPLWWSSGNRCQCHPLMKSCRRSWLNVRHDARLSSTGDQAIADRIGGGQGRGARSITMRSGPFSINRRRAINTNKMIHAGPTRSTRDREISAQYRRICDVTDLSCYLSATNWKWEFRIDISKPVIRKLVIIESFWKIKPQK